MFSMLFSSFLPMSKDILIQVFFYFSFSSSSGVSSFSSVSGLSCALIDDLFSVFLKPCGIKGSATGTYRRLFYCMLCPAFSCSFLLPVASSGENSGNSISDEKILTSIFFYGLSFSPPLVSNWASWSGGSLDFLIDEDKSEILRSIYITQFYF